MSTYKGGKSRRRAPRKLGGLKDYKAIGWRIKRNKLKNRRRDGWIAVKRGVSVCSPCTRSLMNRMQAKEVADKWPKPK